MKIKLLNDTFELENNQESVDRLFDRINSILEDGQYAFDCMEIDGNPVYEEHYDYIISNLSAVSEIKVSIVSVAEMIENILASAAQYIEGALPEISKLSEEFYRGAEQGTWTKLQHLLEGLQWIISSTGVISSNSSSLNGLYEYIKTASELGGKLSELLEAINNSDMVLIGDLLSYEFIPILESIRDTANEIVNSEVDKDAAN